MHLKGFFLVPVLFLSSFLSAQKLSHNTYWIYFTDKQENGYEISQPGQFLSERSVHRRAWQGLGIDQTDEPVTRAYVDEIRNMGAEVRHVSRWLNGLVMVNTSRELYDQVMKKPFVDNLPWEPETDEVYFPPAPAGERFDPPLAAPPGFDYGIASEQVGLVDMEVLHREGYTGGGVWIGVLDAGFRNVDSLPSFKSMISEGRLRGTRNFVSDGSVYREINQHGMYVLSIIGALWDGNMMGTAPHASFYLCMTEDPARETRIEEIAWIEAAEYLDSLGYDVFNTSLGYSEFDSIQYNYRYEDMDGQTTFISRAASMTASKGIIACVSAGNEGNSNWHYITAPSDALDILGVGAVDSTHQISNFSSRGPSFDGRIKPDVVAMGKSAGVQYWNGGVGRGDGTSFSSPLMAGSVAALWQAYPELPASEIMQVIRQNGNRADHPGDEYGFGTPSFARAFWTISGTRNTVRDRGMVLWPNPARDRVMIRIPGEGTVESVVSLYDMSGRKILSRPVQLPCETTLPGGMKPGMYILEISTPRQLYRNPLIIQ